MLRDQSCHCPICRVEKILLLNLNATGSGDGFEMLKNKFPTLRKFASVLDLLEHFHRRAQEDVDPLLDKILTILIQENLGNAPGVSQDVLLLVFMPTIHKTFCEVCLRFSGLSQEDISQQVLTTFLELTRSPGIERRGDHLSIALARSLRKPWLELSRPQAGAAT